jgi:hypothetical protein
MTDLIHTLSLDEFEALALDLESEIKKREHRWDSLIDVKWSTGGAEGGNCWGDEAHYVSGEEEPEDEFITELLEKAAPSITFLQFRRLLKPGLYETRTSCEHEYYGNYTDYSHRKLKLNVLYERLKDLLSSDD